MTLVLLSPESFPLTDVADSLRRHSLHVSAIHLSAIRGYPALPVADEVVLIIPEQGVVAAGDYTTLIREAIRETVPLTLCTSRVSEPDREILADCGASKVITPPKWTTAHVAERVLAEFIFEGRVSPSSFGSLYGATAGMRDLYEHVSKTAPLSDPVLILGETGTGKDLVARELHKRSGRPDPFIAINCAELSPELLASEIFGHERGAFTGAIQSRAGLLSEAGHGTIFLDEIGELDLTAQAKFLRVLEEQRVRRVGSNQWNNVFARIILATNRNLADDCEEGKFRFDLYERIRGFTLHVPPLRARKADIPLLVAHFVDEYNAQYLGNLKIPDGAFDDLFRYDWPGNVRELRWVVRKASAYADNRNFINSVLLQESIRGRESAKSKYSINFNPATETWREVLSNLQTNYFRAVLAEANGNKEIAAKLAGLSRSQFYEKIKETEKGVKDEAGKTAREGGP